MKVAFYYKTIGVLGLVVAVSLALTWLDARASESLPLLLRAGLLTAVLLLLSGPVALWRLRQKKQEEQFRRHIEAMCLCQARLGFGDDTPPLSPGNSWSSLAEQVRKTFVDYRSRLQDSEHARSSQEIRCLRAVNQAEHIKNIFAGLADPILAVDDYDEIVLANQSAEKMFHFEQKKSEERALRQILQCEKLVELLTGVRQRKKVSTRSEELEIACADGPAQWFRATACKLAAGADESGDSSAVSKGAVVVLRNISEQKAVQKRNADFVSSVSHEMKTPLAGIKAYVEMLIDGDAEDEKTREEFLGVIMSQAERLRRLVENMLNLARIEAGVVSVNKQQQSLNQILEEALHVVQPTAEAKNIALIGELSSMYLGVLADRDMLLQAAINLLSNAIKYTPDSGRVTLRSRLDGDQARFEVQDTGVGLSAEDCQRVFEKFYRVKKDKEMASGTGLGLPLAKHIVEDVHGGQLTVESTLGEGSTFCVVLPCTGQLNVES
jgi:two-component system phosphate regulon sensor histidine kinase PhoR